MKITESIFKAYDIRGTVGTELTEEVAEAVAKATADWLPREGDVAVGYDMRPDSQSLAAAVMRGLNGQGRGVVDIGEVTSDMIYFAVGDMDLAGGIMVTASHNPGKDNGIKIYRDEVQPVGLNSGLDEIRDAVIADRFKPKADKPGSVTKHTIDEAWVEHCLKFVTAPLKPFKIAIDAGNGMAGKIMPLIQPKLGLDVTEMFYELDGTFPNHEANPMKPENLADLAEMVKSKGLDFGLAFDGDGDRVGMVDDLGRPVLGSDVVALEAQHFLKLYPGTTIVHDLRLSRSVKELIEEWGGKLYATPVGRSYLGPEIRKRDLPFAGELTGHLYFRDNFYADSGLIGALVAMVALTESGKKLSELVDSYHRYAITPEINFKVTDKQAVLERLEKEFADGTPSHLDGLTVDYPDWWFNVRTSNTEPVVRLNVEAKDEAMLQEKIDEVSKVVMAGEASNAQPA